MAIYRGDIPDPDDDGTGTTGTPGGAPGAGAGAPSVAPVAPLVSTSTLPVSPLDAVMNAHRRSYHKILDYNIPSLRGVGNIGAGGSILTNVSTAITGGLLGSYAFGAESLMQRTIDDIIHQRTGIDYNATARVSDIWVKANNQIHSLSAKIRLCDELEYDLEALMERERVERTLAESIKAQPVAALAKERGMVATMWHAFLEKPVVKDSLRVVKRGAIGPAIFTGIGIGFGVAPMLVSLALAGVLPVGIAAALRNRGKNLLPENNKKSLNKILQLIHSIRKNAEKKRDELLNHVAKGCSREIEISKKLREMIDRGMAHPEAKPPTEKQPWYYELLSRFEGLSQNHTEALVIAFMKKMKEAKNEDKKAAFTKEDQDHMDKQLRIMFSSEAYNDYINVASRQAVGVLREGDPVQIIQGPSQIAAFVKRISQINKLVPQSGRTLELTIGGVKRKLKIKDISSDPDINFKEGLTPESIDDVCLKVITQNDRPKLVIEEYDVSTEALKDEVKDKTEDHLWCAHSYPPPPTGTPDAAEQKRLLHDAKDGKRRLDIKEYRNLWKSFRVLPSDFGQSNAPLLEKIVSSGVDEQVPVVPTAALTAEITVKMNNDLTPTGNPALDARHIQLLADAKSNRLTAAEYTELWNALKPSPHWARNNLPLLEKIATSGVDEQVPVVPTAALTAEISRKTKDHLLPGKSPEEDAEQRKLLRDGGTRRLSISEYRELWASLAPFTDGRSGLTEIAKIADEKYGKKFKMKPLDIDGNDTVRILS